MSGSCVECDVAKTTELECNGSIKPGGKSGNYRVAVMQLNQIISRVKCDVSQCVNLFGPGTDRKCQEKRWEVAGEVPHRNERGEKERMLDVGPCLLLSL